MSNWISVKDRLPEESGEYLAHTKARNYYVLDYSTRHKAFNVCDNNDDLSNAMPVTHWMPLPEPPEAES